VKKKARLLRQPRFSVIIVPSLFGGIMKIGLEIIGALVLAAIVFIVFKLIGLAIHIAIVGAVVGLIVGFIVARMFRRE
jgi:hypothetical protein